MKVTIYIDSDTEFHLDAHKESNVRSLKEDIYRTSDIKSEINLMFKKVILPNAARVCDFAGENETIKLVLIPDKNINISVNTPVKVLRTTISNSCTVEKLKLILLHEYHVKIPLKRQVLRNDSEVIMVEDSMPVHWYGIKEGSFLDLDTKEIRIRIVSESGEALQVLVDPILDTPKDLKQRICSLTNGNFHDGTTLHKDVDFLTLFLCVNGDQFDELLNEKHLMDYSITRKSLIYLLSYSWLDEDQVSVQLANVVTEQALPRDQVQIKGSSTRSNYPSTTTAKHREDYIVFGERLLVGSKAGDSLLSVGLRVQEQLGVAYNTQEFAVLNKAALQKLSVQGCLDPENAFNLREGTVLPLKGAVNYVAASVKLSPKTCHLLFINDSGR